jgi:large subunit ribosomal protein L10
MAITKQKKSEILTKLTEAFKTATSIVFVHFNKVTVAEVSVIRKALRANEVKYVVAKKTLIRKALEQQGYTGTLGDLPGEIAVVWSDGDSTAPARGIHEYVKKLKGTLSIAGGVFQGAFSDAAQMTAIATIPSMTVLRGMFANIINSPRQRFAVALGEVAKLKN